MYAVIGLVALGGVVIFFAVSRAKRSHVTTPSVQPVGFSGPPPPAPPNSTKPMGGGPSDYINAAINLNNDAIRTACQYGGMDPKVCGGIVKVNEVVVQDTIVKPAQWAYDNTLGRIF